jgi:hypothetical protein
MFYKKVFLWFLLSVFVVTQTPLLELIKIPYLIEHYQEHQTKYGNLNFLAFLKMHYFEEQHSALDNHDHLPFKSELQHINIILFHFIAPFQILIFSSLSLIIIPVLIKRNNRLIPQYKANLIWQPPKK